MCVDKSLTVDSSSNTNLHIDQSIDKRAIIKNLNKKVV